MKRLIAWAFHRWCVPPWGVDEPYYYGIDPRECRGS